MSTSSPLQYALENRERFINNLKELLAIPSISTLPDHAPHMERAATWLHDRLTQLGFQTQIIRGAGHPLVYAEWMHAEGAPTVLVYGHYDVQPVDPLELWDSPPFEPSIRDGNIYARGASDDKGQTLTAISAAESLLGSTGTLPVNVKFLIEGEEENGGHVVTQYVLNHGDRLAADVAQVSDTSMFAAGIPTLDTGLRGMVAAQVSARGASRDLHSGAYGGAVPNPLVALAQIIAGLKGADGRITIPGFYDDVVMPEEAVLRSWRDLPFDEAAYLRDEVGATALTGEAEYSVLERTWARPTLDVHGIPGGFTDTGFKTVIPAHAGAKISMRLVPGQRAERILQLFTERVHELTPSGIEIEITATLSDPVLIPTDSPYVRAAREALEETFGQPTVLARSGGSIPIVTLFKEVLAIDSVLMGWGLPDDNLHAPNEKFSLDNFVSGIDATIRFWQGVAAL